VIVQHISSSDLRGGAARAAYRLHCAMRAMGISSTMLVLYRDSDDPAVRSLMPLPFGIRLRRFVSRKQLSFRKIRWRTANLVPHSFGVVDLAVVEAVNHSDADIVHLHWINEMLSVEAIGALQKPLVWTLHDMWPFCGAEHYGPDGPEARFHHGYREDNRPMGESGPDLNRWVWERKCRAWIGQRFHVVAPSRWMAECAGGSVLFRDLPIQAIPNPLDVQFWCPRDRYQVRERLRWPTGKPIILAGASGGVNNWLKGGDLVYFTVLQLERIYRTNFEVAIFGEVDYAFQSLEWPCRMHWLGNIDDDDWLASIYSAADVMLVPSRQDNLPQTAVEAQACGTPVVAFDVGGLSDIVEHQKTGWLARPFDTRHLAEGIAWILSDKERWQQLGYAARARAASLFSYDVVARQYEKLYETVLNLK